MQLKAIKLQRGFTLVEILVVVSIILISVGIAGDLIVSVTRSYTKTRVLNEIEQNGNYLLAKIIYDIKNATLASSSTGSNLQLTTPYGTVVYTAQFQNTSCSGGGNTRTITRSVNGSTALKMTNDACKDGVTLSSDAVFTVQTTANGVTSVSITIPMIQSGSYTSNSPFTASQTFSSVVVLRSGN